MNTVKNLMKSLGVNVAVICRGCNNRQLSNDCHADLDGPSFQSYYCPKCTARMLDNGTAVLAEVCESCGQLATCHDADDIALCVKCGHVLIIEDEQESADGPKSD